MRLAQGLCGKPSREVRKCSEKLKYEWNKKTGWFLEVCQWECELTRKAYCSYLFVINVFFDNSMRTQCILMVPISSSSLLPPPF